MNIRIYAENGEEELQLSEFCDRYGLDEAEVLEVMEKEGVSVEYAIYHFRPKYYMNLLGQIVIPKEQGIKPAYSLIYNYIPQRYTHFTLKEVGVSFFVRFLEKVEKEVSQYAEY